MIRIGRLVLHWIGRHLLALVLILLILIAGRYAWEPARDWLKGQSEAARALPAARTAYAEASAEFDAYARTRQAEAERMAGELARAPEAALRARRSRIDPAIVEAQRDRLATAQLAMAAASGRSDRSFAHYRAGAEVELLERERRAIDATLAARTAQDRRTSLQARRAAAIRQLRASHRQWLAARDRAQALNRRPLAGPRNLLCRTARPPVGCDNYRALAQARAQMDAALAANRRARAIIVAVDRAAQALATSEAAVEQASALFDAQRRQMAERQAELARSAGDNWILWIGKPILETLPVALAILAAAIVAPILIKALLYFLVAPLAARRPPIRLVESDAGNVSELSSGSAVSHRLPLDPSQELLVVPEAVQSTSHEADKATKWMLSWTMPLSSLASGMVGLIRIRPRQPDFVLVSATEDPLAEIALISLEEGSAMVLRPRALRGLIQPRGRPVRISRHWRLGHLSAWLTLQFRYLVFHGPCILVVQGTRGVRLERAGAGRGINQAATIGFSAGLAYGVRRGEAFGAYLMGKQELFNDSFRDDRGYYLYEEMPREGSRAGLWGRGLSGLGDAALKIFGI